MAPTNFVVTLTNIATAPVAPGAPFVLAPTAYAVHEPGAVLVPADGFASPGLESMAEDGMGQNLAAEPPGRANVHSSGAQAVGIDNTDPGPTGPGSGYRFEISAQPGDWLSVRSMFGQSNDLFYALPREGAALFDGTLPRSADLTSDLSLLDAGTEINQPPGVGADQAVRQAAPKTGASERRPIGPVADNFGYPATSQVVRLTITPAATQRINLQGNGFYPEGIHALTNGDLLVGGFGDGSIQRIAAGGAVSYFNEPGASGAFHVVGFSADERNNRLWVANFTFDGAAGGLPGSNLKVFELSTGRLLKSIPESLIPGVFFNEVVLDSNQRIYVTNTFGPQIYTTRFTDNEARVFAQGDLLSNPAPDQPFDLNGLAITPDGRWLIASVMDRLDAGDGRLVRISLADGSLTAIRLTGPAAPGFAGSDGMFFHDGRLLMVNVFSGAGAIVAARFDAGYTAATLRVFDAAPGTYVRPTASAVLNGRLYTVNSQLNHIIDDADSVLGRPPSLPFQVVSVPLR